MRRLNRNFKLQPGAFEANEPIISLIPGKRGYLWIGNDASGDGRCFGTLSGRQRLLKLARLIIDELGGGRTGGDTE